MHIYSNSDLYNKHIENEISEARSYKIIGEEAYINILSAHVTGLYTPNYFIRIALAVLTFVSIIFSGFLLAMIFQMQFTALLLFFAVINYIALEFLVSKKVYYNAGVDNLLMFFSAAFITSAFATKAYIGQDVVASGVALLVCLYLSIRFVDGFMAVLSYLALLVFVFLLYTKLGNTAKATAPFLMMIVSACIYAIMKKLIKNEKLVLYRYCFKSIQQVTLIAFYAVTNYFVVKELSNEMFGLHLALKDPIPFGWLFWVFIFVIPVVYIGYGIIKKDLMFIRTGLVLAAATVFTYKYYYSVVSVEVAMLAGGVLIIAVSHSIIKYLKIAKAGFCFERKPDSKQEQIDLKLLTITQVSGKKVIADTGAEFGGGSFGGGGAGGNY